MCPFLMGCDFSCRNFSFKTRLQLSTGLVHDVDPVWNLEILEIVIVMPSARTGNSFNQSCVMGIMAYTMWHLRPRCK